MSDETQVAQPAMQYDDMSPGDNPVSIVMPGGEWGETNTPLETIEVAAHNVGGIINKTLVEAHQQGRLQPVVSHWLGMLSTSDLFDQATSNHLKALGAELLATRHDAEASKIALSKVSEYLGSMKAKRR